LVDRAHRRQPRPQVELAAAPVPERGERVVVLHHEPAGYLLALGYGPPGQVEVAGRGDIGARGVAEELELRADPGVEVQQLVLAVPGVEPDVEVEDPLVAD